MGSYRTFRRGSSCYAVLVLLLLIGLLVPWGVSADVPAGETERVILYIDPGSNITPGLLQNYSSVSDNCTIVLQALDLHFVVAEIPVNESGYYRNELLNLPWVSRIESDGIRYPELLYNSTQNDPHFSDEWALHQIHVQEAWNNLSPYPDIPRCTVAILDTGIDVNHEDLKGIITKHGYDWVENRDVLEDPDGHGTFLAGIVGAVAGNNKGVAGVAPVFLLPERVGTNISGIFASRSAVAIKHAADSGAQIILMGYGGPGQSPAEDAAIAYAAKKGCILIAPAGNNASNEGHYPSDNSEVISVGSTAKTDGLSYFSNYGIFVELVAPGEEILSTWPGNTYQSATGSSASAALVAGAAALILEADPTLTRDQVRNLLTMTARDLGRCGRDIYYGYGILDIGAAMKEAVSVHKRPVNSAITPEKRTDTPMNSSLRNDSAFSDVPPVKRSSRGTLSSVQISLESGWNFISLPYVPGSGKTSGEVFQGINTDSHTIWKYNSSARDWIAIEKDSDFTPLEGFLVYSDRKTSIPMVLDEGSERKGIQVIPGWNLIGSTHSVPVPAHEGLSHLSSDWVSLLQFNSSAQTYDPAIIQGANGTHSDERIIPAFSAFWVYMNDSGLAGAISETERY